MEGVLFASDAPLNGFESPAYYGQPPLLDRLLFASCWTGIGGFGCLCWWSLLMLLQSVL